MCGLFGHITNKDKVLTKAQQRKRTRIIQALGLAMQSRGTHSTGVMYEKEGAYIIEKKAKDAYSFFKEAGKELFNELDTSRICIGHTRLATQGAINDMNAHPFQKGTIIGAHNGIVYNSDEVDKMLDLKHEVDSESIFALLNEWENDHKALSLLEGQFALTWLHTKDNNFHMVREKNPLFYAYSKELDSYFWCSEFLALQTILIAGGLGDVDVYELAENTLVTLTPELQLTTTKDVQFKEYSPTYFKYDTYKAGAWDEPDFSYYASKTTTTGKKKKKDKSMITVSPVDSLMSIEKKDVFDQVINGCAYCNAEIILEEGFYYSSADYAVICPQCMDDEEVYGATYFDENDFIKLANEVGQLGEDESI